MSLDRSGPRVTLGIATYNRDTYLREAVQSCLEQDFTDLEVLVVVDGSTNPGVAGAQAQPSRGSDPDGPPPRLRGSRRLRRSLPAGQRLRLLAARGARVSLPSLPGRSARRDPSAWREHLR